MKDISGFTWEEGSGSTVRNEIRREGKEVKITGGGVPIQPPSVDPLRDFVEHASK